MQRKSPSAPKHVQFSTVFLPKMQTPYVFQLILQIFQPTMIKLVVNVPVARQIPLYGDPVQHAIVWDSPPRRDWAFRVRSG